VLRNKPTTIAMRTTCSYVSS